jgi:hypothetical protein
LYNDAEKSYLISFIVVICIAISGAIIVSFLPKSGIKPNKELSVSI